MTTSFNFPSFESFALFFVFVRSRRRQHEHPRFALVSRTCHARGSRVLIALNKLSCTKSFILQGDCHFSRLSAMLSPYFVFLPSQYFSQIISPGPNEDRWTCSMCFFFFFLIYIYFFYESRLEYSLVWPGSDGSQWEMTKTLMGMNSHKCHNLSSVIELGFSTRP